VEPICHVSSFFSTLPLLFFSCQHERWQEGRPARAAPEGRGWAELDSRGADGRGGLSSAGRTGAQMAHGADRQGLAGVRLARRRRDGWPELGLGAPAHEGQAELGSCDAARARGSTSAGRAAQLGGGRPELRTCSAARYRGSGGEAACEGARRDATWKVLRSMRQQSMRLGGKKEEAISGAHKCMAPRE
jgi:hypothetical protein